ncbi:MAG: hypothetical protein AB1295_02885 [Candidatus Micrarchaeota archaeon]
METRSATRRNSDNHGAVQPQRSNDKIRKALKQASKAGLETIMPKVCDPQGEPELRLHNHLASIEPGLAAMAASEDGWEMCVFTTDKARQNPINKLGGYDAAGDASLEAYWEGIGQAVAMTSSLLDCDPPVFLRVSGSSDEGVLVIIGKDMSGKLASDFGPRTTMEEVLREAWALAREDLDLPERTYMLTTPGDGSMVQLDLHSFSQVLRHPDMIVSCNFSASDPAPIRPNKMGFIGNEIRRLENDEVAFYSYLPNAFRVPNGGRAEVLSPFGDNLALMAERDRSLRRMSGGTFIEVKLKAREKDAMDLLPFTADFNGFKGTRKGFAEIFSGRLGMRGLNTYIGKARTNSVLTPIAQAMGSDVGKEHAVIPVTGGYLQYWLDMPPTEETARFIQDSLRSRLHSDVMGDPGHTNLGLDPEILMLDARELDIGDVRAKFILKSLGKDNSPAWILDAADFIPNFVENVHPAIQKEIYDALGMSAADMDGIRAVEQICENHRTIRDAEDLVWAVRNGRLLHGLEGWLFEFAERSYHKMFEMLTDKARRFSVR